MSDEHDEEHSVELPPFSENGDEKSLDHVTRVEESLRVGWNGVRSCCDDDRIKQEVGSEFSSWVKRVRKQHADKRFLGAGHGGGSVSCRSSGGGIGGGRSCGASVTIKAYAEFE